MFIRYSLGAIKFINEKCAMFSLENDNKEPIRDPLGRAGEIRGGTPKGVRKYLESRRGCMKIYLPFQGA